MKSQLIVKLEGWIAFLIPFLTTFTAASFVPSLTWAQVIQVFAAASVAGLSGLKSFLSTTFSDSLPASLVENQVAIPAIQPPHGEKPMP